MLINISKTDIARLVRLAGRASDIIRANSHKARDIDTARLLRKTVSDIIRRNNIMNNE